MKTRFYLIIGVMVGIYGGINYFIGSWLWKHLFSNIAWLNSRTYYIAFFILVIASLVGVIMNHYLPKLMQDDFYLAGAYWLGAMVYFAIIIAIVELIRILNKYLGFIPSNFKYNLFNSVNIGILVLASVIILLIYGTINGKNTKITSYKINISKQAGELKQLHIALLSDIHLGSLQDKGMENLVDKINGIKPDIVLIAGDIIDASRDTKKYELKSMENSFKKIKSKYGIYACLGNHDYDFNGDPEYRVKRFKEAGVNILRDSFIKIEDSFYVIGREDVSYGRISGQKRKVLSEAMKAMDMKLPVIVLDHQPSNLEEPKEEGVDLQLSGHTHKGQMFPFYLITKRIFKTDYGYLNLDGLQVIVSSGARTWGPPIRIGSNSEVVDLMINFNS